MKKVNVLWLILDLIFLVVFNTIFFVIGGSDHSLAVWLSYAFIHVSYLLFILTPLLVKKAKEVSVFGIALMAIASAYFLIEFGVGIFFILTDFAWKTIFLVHVIITGIYAIILVLEMIAAELASKSNDEGVIESDYVEVATKRLQKLEKDVEDSDIQKQINNLRDYIKVSRKLSNANAQILEAQIIGKIDGLRELIFSNNSNKTDETAYDKEKSLKKFFEELFDMAEARNKAAKAK